MFAALPCGILAVFLSGTPSEPESMRDLIQRWVTDRHAIERFYDLPLTQHREDVLDVFYVDWLKRLDGIDFDALGPDGRIDYLLLQGEIRYRRRELKEERRERERLLGLLPFARQILVLEEGRRRMDPIDGRQAAGWIAECQREIKRIKGRVEKAIEKGGESRPADSRESAPAVDFPTDPESAWRAADRVRDLRGVLETWHGNVGAFDPEIAWWVVTPYQATLAALDDYEAFLRKAVAKATGDDSDPLFGRPIGREALKSALDRERIVYPPEILIELANRHATWCITEMKRAAGEMKLGDDWKRALEKVKSDSVPPGKQSDLVEEQAKDAIAFCDRLELVTIPPLCRQTWRLDMISGNAQRNLPFASYGGLGMNVAYPSVEMEHDRKLMAMRGNNLHFSRLVTPHELIPGHHLQSFIAAREKPWRREFSTPFHVEGWAVYGEILFYNLGFSKAPEDRIGALLWRLHRCARVVLSLRYHLGETTPPKMVDYLVDEVGLERDGATAEVRRYLRGGYGPLYQCGYLIGALQVWRLREELDVGRKTTERAFHDAFLAQGPIPVELARAALLRIPLKRDFAPTWRFGG